MNLLPIGAAAFPIDQAATRTLSKGRLFIAATPQFPAGGWIQGEQVLVGGQAVKHTFDHKRIGGHRRGLTCAARVITPGDFALHNIVTGNLVQRAVLVTALVTKVDVPLAINCGCLGLDLCYDI